MWLNGPWPTSCSSPRKNFKKRIEVKSSDRDKAFVMSVTVSHQQVLLFVYLNAQYQAPSPARMAWV